jgi:hypothetical protein
MPITNWVALLSITHRYKFTEAELRARREVFEGTDSSILGPVKKICLAKVHSVPIRFIIPALEDLVQRPKPLDEEEIVNLPSKMVARIGVAREKYVRESSRAFASKNWLKQVAHNTVKSVWKIKPKDEVPDGD